VAPENGGSVYRQRAIYFPSGLSGKLYWWLVLPFHGLIFPSMARNIIHRAAMLGQTADAAANVR
jgi:Protein of unknown function (DUF2867)